MEIRSTHLTDEQWAIVDRFHQLYYGRNTLWMGVPILKTPLDLLIYQEILWRVKPDTLIECGTCLGGSALYFAQLMDLIGHGHVISIDVETDLEKLYDWALGGRWTQPVPDARPQHPRITYLTGSTVDPIMVHDVRQRCGRTVMAVLDSAHYGDHVLRECEAYGPMVTPGSYLVVEDVNLGGHPVNWYTEGPGPFDAMVTYLIGHPEFSCDVGWTDRYLMSYNAYLLRMEDQG